MAAFTPELARANTHWFILFRISFIARFYYPVYTVLFLDYGLTLEQFGLLNVIWAITIVLLEVPSGALADTLGRRNLLVLTGVLMVIEIGLLLIAPINGGWVLFGIFALNRILSGAAEAAASGADEALAYDSLKRAGLEDQWPKVLEKVQRFSSIAFFVAMLLGASVYDPSLINKLGSLLGLDWAFNQEDLVKMPIWLTMGTAIITLFSALRMHECQSSEEIAEEQSHFGETVRQCFENTATAGRWIWVSALPFSIIGACMILDSVVRQYLTLASEYYRIIDYPIATFGIIGSSLSLLGLFVPAIARYMNAKASVIQNFMTVAALVLLGLLGLTFAVPYWGIIPSVILHTAFMLMNFFVSANLNKAAPSEQRATILSFRGLTNNIAYGVIGMFYALLIIRIKADKDIASADGELSAAMQESVYVEALAWFPGYFLVTLLLFVGVYALRFGRK